MMEESALKIHEEADKQIRGKGTERKEKLFEGQITWWEERKEEAREFLERQTQAGTMHKTHAARRDNWYDAPSVGAALSSSTAG